MLGAAALALAGCGASSSAKQAQATSTARRDPAPKPRALSPAARSFGLPPVPAGPVPGYVLIADRNNDRILLVSPQKRVVWQFPRAKDLRPGQSFHDPDDAFFTPGYTGISTNEEYNQTLGEIDVKTHRIVWSYGHPQVRGSGPGYLSNPDDAYLLRDGLFMVADIQNCRVLFIDRAHRVVRSIGHAGACGHRPPSGLSSPNGATPLADGGVLVTEIGGWVDRIDAHGRLVYSIRTPTAYPSDAQLLPNGHILVAGFDTPGRVDELTRTGLIVWTYGPTSGPGALDRPSLAVRWPNGMIAVTDDWRHRIVVIDPRTKQIVWQYGHLDVASSAPGYLSKPDGLDLLPATIAARTRPVGLRTRTVKHAARRLAVARVGTLPAAASRLAAVALPDGRVMALGGLVSGTSSTQILLGPPQRLRLAGRVPVASHDDAAALVGRSVELFGGGQAISSDGLVRIDPTTGKARTAGHLDEPLSDLGAVRIAKAVYLVGGYTGSRYASAVLRVHPTGSTSVVARLPAGLRYAGVAVLGGTIYVAGGLRTGGETGEVDAVDPRTGAVRRVATLPTPVAHAPLVTIGGALYLVGGTDTAGQALATILRIDPATGRVTIAGHLPMPLADAAAVSLGATGIILGGGGARPSAAVLELRAG